MVISIDTSRPEIHMTTKPRKKEHNHLDLHNRCAQVVNLIEEHSFHSALKILLDMGTQACHINTETFLCGREDDFILIAKSLINMFTLVQISHEHEIKETLMRTSSIFLQLVVKKCVEEGVVTHAMRRELEEVHQILSELYEDTNCDKIDPALQIPQHFYVSFSLEMVKCLKKTDWSCVKKLIPSKKSWGFLFNAPSVIAELHAQIHKMWAIDLYRFLLPSKAAFGHIEFLEKESVEIHSIARKNPTFALGCVELFGDLIECGDRATEQFAASQICALVELRGTPGSVTYWKVRFRAAQYLFALSHSKDSYIQKTVLGSLIRLNRHEKKPQVKKLIADMELFEQTNNFGLLKRLIPKRPHFRQMVVFSPVVLSKAASKTDELGQNLLKI